MSTRIFVMTHKSCEPTGFSEYTPLQVGAAKNGKIPGYVGDDTGDNISALNKYYGELTGVYWIWKNYHEDDFIGVCHYRRYFTDEENNLLGEGQIEEILKKHSIIVPRPNISFQTNEEGYAESHNINDLYACGRAIGKLCPEYGPYFEENLKSHRSYFANLMITSHEKYDEYCRWLFSIIDEAKDDIDVSGYDSYHKRVYGFLSEQLLTVWVKGSKLLPYECHVGITSEKVETRELKKRLQDLVTRKNYTAARQAYYSAMEKRPDVRLAGSDFNGELGKIECILYIMEQEKLYGQESFAGVSSLLKDLILHYDNITSILKALGEGSATQEMIEYLYSTKTTTIATEVIMRNTAGIQNDVVRQILGMPK